MYHKGFFAQLMFVVVQTGSLVKVTQFIYLCWRIYLIYYIYHITMKEDYKNISNEELSKRISKKTQELIDLRNELSRRAGEKIPITNYDFTQRVNK